MKDLSTGMKMPLSVREENKTLIKKNRFFGILIMKSVREIRIQSNTSENFFRQEENKYWYLFGFFKVASQYRNHA